MNNSNHHTPSLPTALFHPMDQLLKQSRESPEKFWASFTSFFRWSRRPNGFRLKDSEGLRFFSGGMVPYIESLFGNHPESHPALVVYDKDGRRNVYSRGDLKRKIASVAAFLRQAGLPAGQTLWACVSDKETAALLSLACLYAGLQFGFIHPGFSSSFIEYLCERTRPDYFLYEPSSRRRSLGHPRFKKGSSLKKLIVLGDSNPSLRSLFSETVFWDRTFSGNFSLDPHDWKSDAPTLTFFSTCEDPHPPIVSAGTAGAYLTNLLHYYLIQRPDEGLSSWVPFDFTWGPTFILGLFCPLYFGVPVVIDKRPFDVNHERTRQILHDEKVGSMLLSPFYFRKTPTLNKPLELKRGVFTGNRIPSAPLANIQKFLDVQNGQFFATYGQNECCSLLFYGPIPPSGPAESLGLSPLPGVLHRLGPGQGRVGRLEIETTLPSLGRSYLKNSDQYQGRWLDGGDYFNTKCPVEKIKNNCIRLLPAP